MKKKRPYYFNTGYASILFIFFLLCLVTFSTLSLVTANADYKLSLTVADRTLDYYEACNTAEEQLSDIDGTLLKLYQSSNNSFTFYQDCQQVFSNSDAYQYACTYTDVSDSTSSASVPTLSYEVPVSDTQTLYVTLTIRYPDKERRTLYELTQWQLITSDTTDEYTDNYHLFGTDNE